jgi:hypothetical protein
MATVEEFWTTRLQRTGEQIATFDPVDRQDPRAHLLDTVVECWDRTWIPAETWAAAQALLGIGDLPALTTGGDDALAKREDRKEYEQVFRRGVVEPLHQLVDAIERAEYATYSSEGTRLLRRDREDLVSLAKDVKKGIARWMDAI